MTLEQLTSVEIMELDPAQFEALAWINDQCEDCPLAGQCDVISRELCSGALRIDNAGE